MANVRFISNPMGLKDLLKAGGYAGVIGDKAEAIASACNARTSDDRMSNPSFDWHYDEHPTRTVAHVTTASPHGRYAQRKNHLLQGAIGGLR